MKKRKILYFLPVFSLLLTGCDFASIMDKAKDLGGKIVNPIKDLINPDKEGDNGEGGGNQEGEGGNEEGGGGEEQQVVAVSIKELIGVPAEIVQGETLAASSLKATVIYSDNSSKTEDVTKVELDTSKVGEATGKAYVNTLVKEFTINVKAKEEHHEDEDKPTHAGTMEDPYTGADAVIVANGLEGGAKTPESYYIKGKVTELREEFNSQYGNYSFAIEGGFVCWRLMKQGGVAFNDGDIAVGDEVLVYAQIMKYVKGEETTLETSGGYVVSVQKEGKAEINGVVGIASMPESLEVNDVLKPADVMLNVTLSDGTTDVVAATEVSCDTSVPGEATVTASYLAFAPVTGTIIVNAPAAKIPGDFYKVKTQDEIEAGTYLIVYEDTKPDEKFKAFSGADAANGFVEINAEKGHVAANESLVKVEAEEMEGGFSLKVLDGDNAGKYMYGTSGNNGLKFGESPVLHTFEHTEEGNDRIVCDSTFFSFNKSDGQMRFRYYKSENQQPVSLYKMEPTAPAELESISIEGELGKVSYFEGESYITQGLSVLAHYSDGSSKEVEAAITLDKDIAAVGDTAVLASAEFEGKTVNLSFDVTVVAVELVSITADITNKLYTVDDELSLEGLVVTGTYNNETTADLTASAQTSLEAGHILTADDTSLVVSVGEVQTTISLTINPKQEEGAELVSIAITSELHREFNVGEEFVGEQVTASYTKGDPRVVEATFSGYDMSVAGSQTVKASYTEGEITKEATYSIEVKALPELASIEVTNAPDKVEYLVGETFDPTGMVVQANYTAGKASAVITGYTFSTDALTASDESIELSYTEDGVTKTTSVAITVSEPARAELPYTGVIAGGALPEGWELTGNGATFATSYYALKADGAAVSAVKLFDERSSVRVIVSCVANGTANDSTVTVYGLDDSGAKIEGAVASFTPVKATASNAAGIEANKADHAVMISGEGITGVMVELTVKGHNLVLTSISVTEPPVLVSSVALDKTEMSLEYPGANGELHATVSPDNAENKEVEWSVEGSSVTVKDGVVTPIAVGESTVTATAKDGSGKSASCVVTVSASAKELESISVTTQPDKTAYESGEVFDPTGMVVTANYVGGESEPITDYTFSTDPIAVGTTSIAISYGGKSTSVAITVTAAKGSTIENPYTIDEVIAACSSLESYEWLSEKVYVQGIVKGYAASSSNKYTLKDEDGTEFIVYKSALPAEGDRACIGDTAIFYGYVENYNGTLEMTNNTSDGVHADLPTTAAILSRGTSTISLDSNSSENATVTFEATATNASEYTFTVEAKNGFEIKEVTFNGDEISGNDGSYTVTILGNSKICVETKSEGEVEPQSYKTVSFLKTNSTNSIQDYVSTAVYTDNNFSVTTSGFNNNKLGWDYIKAGKKNSTTTNTITTNSAIDKAVKEVAIDFGAVTISHITSAKILVSSTADMANATEYAFNVEANKLVKVSTGNGSENCFYQIVFVINNPTNSNGSLVVNSIDFRI